jgi:fructose/tagatose bisphosphate aldolase
MAAVERAAERSALPVAIHLDHGESLESAVRAVKLGCTGVMVDASSFPLQENIARTRASPTRSGRKRRTVSKSGAAPVGPRRCWRTAARGARWST